MTCPITTISTVTAFTSLRASKKLANEASFVNFNQILDIHESISGKLQEVKHLLETAVDPSEEWSFLRDCHKGISACLDGVYRTHLRPLHEAQMADYEREKEAVRKVLLEEKKTILEERNALGIDPWWDKEIDNGLPSYEPIRRDRRMNEGGESDLSCWKSYRGTQYR